MTLLLSAFETTASTLTFFIYELARRPDIAERIVVELQDGLEDGRPNAARLMGGEFAELEMALDEALRLYPSTWIGPRRATEAFESVLERQGRALAASKTVTEGLVRAIAQEIASKRVGSGYGPTAARRAGPATAITLNQRA